MTSSISRRFYSPLIFLVLFGAAGPVVGQSSNVTNTSQHLEIKSLIVSGKNVPLSKNNEIKLPASSDKIEINFGVAGNQTWLPTRLRFKLVGFDNEWQIGGGFMSLAVRFYGSNGQQIDQKVFKAFGESANWTGSLEHSALIHRREGAVVPQGASRVMIVISSAGPPSTEGVYVVANLTVSKASDKSSVAELLCNPFDPMADGNDLSEPAGWVRDGLVPGMAKIIKIGKDPTIKAFAIIDNEPESHAEWHNIINFIPRVTPGDNLVIEWNEMFSVGVEDLRVAYYDNLPSGKYTFNVENVDTYGTASDKATLDIIVLPPLWKTAWFWYVISILGILSVFGAGRYAVSRKLKQEMMRLKSQEALEKERIRIAQDIHDDLGARVTQISLISAMAHANPKYSDSAREDFDQITRHSRELVAALYETVWAVNPENDTLYALGNYLCQMVNLLCERAQFSCRFDLIDLPRNIQATSQIRHNITMAAKEAVHNAIKHANASQLTVGAVFKDNILKISIQDDGKGFQFSKAPHGHGLSNMEKRLEEIGGTCQIESHAGKGTTVTMTLKFESSNRPANHL